MREHQIVITLKPDQFLEVQRLARAANAKSMGVFVRQQLLAALGIEGALQTDAAAQNVDVDALLSDLKRVHGDLKSFVAESLSPYSPEAFGRTEPVPVQEAQLPDEDDVLEDPDVVSPAVAALFPETMPDELERIADKAFAISPRLGAVGEASAQAEKAAPPKAQSTHELLARHELHYRRDIHRYNHPHAASEFMDVPFNEANSANAGPAGNFADLSVQPPSSAVGDPLARLLSGDELTSRPIKPRLQLEPDDDETFDVPLSIAERTRTMPGEIPAPMVEAPHPALQPTSPADLPEYIEAGAASEPPSYEVAQAAAEPPEDNSPQISAPQAAEIGTVSTSSSAQSDKNPLTQPLGYPPLSGSPPPKRRQL